MGTRSKDLRVRQSDLSGLREQYFTLRTKYGGHQWMHKDLFFRFLLIVLFFIFLFFYPRVGPTTCTLYYRLDEPDCVKSHQGCCVFYIHLRVHQNFGPLKSEMCQAQITRHSIFVHQASYQQSKEQPY
jgi:hypothetical protein